jgi:NADH-quinone oxidoreductase subunit N
MAEWSGILPFCIPALWGLMTLLLGVFLPQAKRFLLNPIALMGAAVTPVFSIMAYKAGEQVTLSGGTLLMDTYALFFHLLLSLAVVVTILVSGFYLEREKLASAEFYALLLFGLSGMLLMVSGRELMLLFIAIEILSMSVYILTGYLRNSLKANEGAFKYFLLGSLSSALMLYGIALIYGATHSTQVATLSKYFSTQILPQPLAGLGVFLLLIGLAFKVAAVPFHAWSPDAYETAAMPVTGFMATAVKAAVFALLIRLLAGPLILIKSYWVEIIGVLALLSILGGNILAYTQQNIKRMLAYSSIAHTGYLLAGITGLTQQANGQTDVAPLLYYLLIYVLTSLGIFAALTWLSHKDETCVNISDLSGLSKSYPLTALGISVLLLSFMGIPPLGGFFAKYYLFLTAIEAHQLPLVVVAILGSILSLVYYLRVMMVMYFEPEATHWMRPASRPVTLGVVLGGCSFAVLWVGFAPVNFLNVFPGLTPLLNWLQQAQLYTQIF